MDVEVLLGKKVQFTRRLEYPIALRNKNKKTYDNTNKSNSKSKSKSTSNNNNKMNTFKIPFPKKKKSKYIEDSDEDDDDEEEYQDENYDDDDEEINDLDDDDEDEDLDLNDDNIDTSNLNNNNTNSSLRRYHKGILNEEEQNLLNSLGGNKKPKKVWTEEDIAKKVEQTRLRRLHSKKMWEEAKRLGVEKIWNEDGRKWRERQKKLNEDIQKKAKAKEEKYKWTLTKIKQLFYRDGKKLVRFPEGFWWPSVLLQKKKEIKEIALCDVEGCNNKKLYTDPKTKKNYCSVKCYKMLKGISI